jgi:hypothetical protein
MNIQGRIRSKEEMFPVIEEWKASEQTIKAYCEQKDIAKSVFSYWYKKYKEEGDAEGFIPIHLRDDNRNVTGSFIEIEYPNRVIVRLPANTKPQVIGQYLHL